MPEFKQNVPNLFCSANITWIILPVTIADRCAAVRTEKIFLKVK